MRSCCCFIIQYHIIILYVSLDNNIFCIEVHSNQTRCLFYISSAVRCDLIYSILIISDTIER
jgi:hypothetical protein